MIKRITILILLLRAFTLFSQSKGSFFERNYIGFYSLGISKEVRNDINGIGVPDNQLGFSYEFTTTQGFILFKYFVLSAMIGIDKHSKYDRIFVPVKADLKWFLKNVKSEELNPFIYINVGKNISFSDNFAGMHSNAMGLGFLMSGDEEQIYIAIESKLNNDFKDNKSYSFGSFGIKIGVTF